MTQPGEAVDTIEGPPIYDDRQIRPKEFENFDDLLNYVGGIAVELVHISSERVWPIIIDEVNRTFPIDKRPDSSEPATPDEKEGWIDFGQPAYVTFYRTVTEDGGKTRYEYYHISASGDMGLGLAPKVPFNVASGRWPEELLVYLRWPERSSGKHQDLAPDPSLP